MTVKAGFHGDRFDADVTEYFESDSPFVTFEVKTTDYRTDYYNRQEDGSYRVNKVQTGEAVFFVRTVEDAYRILEAANQLVRSVEDMEFDRNLKEVLKNDIESFFNPDDL